MTIKTSESRRSSGTSGLAHVAAPDPEIFRKLNLLFARLDVQMDGQDLVVRDMAHGSELRFMDRGLRLKARTIEVQASEGPTALVLGRDGARLAANGLSLQSPPDQQAGTPFEIDASSVGVQLAAASLTVDASKVIISGQDQLSLVLGDAPIDVRNVSIGLYSKYGIHARAAAVNLDAPTVSTSGKVYCQDIVVDVGSQLPQAPDAPNPPPDGPPAPNLPKLGGPPPALQLPKL